MDSANNIQFYKYQGTGNDFVMVDNRKGVFPKDGMGIIQKLCDRRFGIGADGLILLENDKMSDFRMVYYNADGKESTMCGNGGRCIVAFAHYLGVIGATTTFNAVDGMHDAQILGDEVVLNMMEVSSVQAGGDYFFLDTGSPHHVALVQDLDAYDVLSEGAKLRYGQYGKEGSNINFVERVNEHTYSVRTYERGVEGETLSCGTGVTAVALAMHFSGDIQTDAVMIKTKGGALKVQFKKEGDRYVDIKLIGPARQVFKGEVLW